jgi:hypothetical protein
MPAGLVVMPVDHAQSKADAVACLLGRKEWIEDLFDDFLRDACSCIDLGRYHILTRPDIRMRAFICMHQDRRLGLECWPAFEIDGIARIDC